MWGVVYQGYNAIFPSFYPELFPTRTRVSAMAISQNVGTTITALLPALFATVAPPGSANIPVTVGAIAFGITVIAALAAITRPGNLPGQYQRSRQSQRRSDGQGGIRKEAR